MFGEFYVFLSNSKKNKISFYPRLEKEYHRRFSESGNFQQGHQNYILPLRAQLHDWIIFLKK